MVLNTGDIWSYQSTSLPCSESTKLPSKVIVNFSDNPTFPFMTGLKGKDDLYLMYVSFVSPFFTLFSVRHPDGSFHHLKSFFWTMKYCSQFDTPPIGTRIGKRIKQMGKVIIGSPFNGLPPATNVSAMVSLAGKPAAITANDLFKNIEAPDPEKGNFEFTCGY